MNPMNKAIAERGYLLVDPFYGHPFTVTITDTLLQFQCFDFQVLRTVSKS